jgi:DNA-binding XRE family transcriptional regulator
MPDAPLPNYIRSNRKRAGLTQREVAFILGAKSSAAVSRHERSKQMPDLPTVLAYEMLFRTPVRSIFSGTQKQMRMKLLRRIRLLIRKLAAMPHRRGMMRKIEILRTYVEELLIRPEVGKELREARF